MHWHGLAILWLFCNPLFSQGNIVLEGRIVDSTSASLADIVVQLLQAQDSALVKTDISNNEGRFTYNQVKQGNYYLYFHGIGYRAEFRFVDLSQGQERYDAGSIQLNALSQNLKEVEIVSRKSFLERQADKLFMNVENSIHSAGNSALELLQKAPGVVVNQDQSIAISGKQSVIISIDGRKVQLSGVDLMNYLRTIQSSNISKIEIIANPSAKYDAEGNAGIIDIKLKKDNREGFNGNTNLSLGQGKYFKPAAGVNANFRKNKVNLYGNYSYSKPDNFTNFYINRQFFNSQREVNSIFDQSSNIKQGFQSHSVKLGVDYYFNPKIILGSFLFLNNGDVIRDGQSNSLISNQAQQLQYSTKTKQYLTDDKINALANINFKRSFEKLSKELSLDLDYGNYKLHTEQDFKNQYLDPNAILFDSSYLNSLQNGGIDVYSAKLDYSQMIKKVKIETGAKLSLVHTENDLRFYNLINDKPSFDSVNSSTFSYKENINAAYLILNSEYRNIEYQIGLRMEQTYSKGLQHNSQQAFSRHLINFFPSFLVHYKKWKNNDVSFSYTRRIDRPSFRQLQPFRIFVDPYTYVVGDPKLQPSLTHSFQLSNTFFGKILTEFNYSVSENVITDVFTQDDSTKISYQSPANINDSKSYTLTFSIPIQKVKWLNSNVDLSGFHTSYDGPLGNATVSNYSYSWYVNMQNSILLPNNWTGEISFFYQSKMAWGQFTILELSQLNLGIQKQSKNKLSTYKLAVSDLFHKNKIRVVVDQDNQKFHTDRNWDSTVATFSYSYRFGKSSVQRARQRQSGMEDEKRRAG
ncbi:MAG TPA: TonB-dependent receptor [Saprospiraceae bacterium]|nr:TonB-dependent receptor [Saprospiraceae bacterium]